MTSIPNPEQEQEMAAYLDALLGTKEDLCDRIKERFIKELVKARRSKGVSQMQLGNLCGVKQPVIARLETGAANARLDTILKLLAALDLTLAIVPLEE